MTLSSFSIIYHPAIFDPPQFQRAQRRRPPSFRHPAHRRALCALWEQTIHVVRKWAGRTEAIWAFIGANWKTMKAALFIAGCSW